MFGRFVADPAVEALATLANLSDVLCHIVIVFGRSIPQYHVPSTTRVRNLNYCKESNNTKEYCYNKRESR